MVPKTIASLLVVLISVASTQAVAEAAVLTVTPSKCVALRKGNTCYQSIVVRFAAEKDSDICLIRDGVAEPLACWEKVASIEYSYKLATDSSVMFHMVDAQQLTIASALVNVAWVYKKSRKRNRWRLF